MENEIYFSWKLKIGEGKGGKYLEMKDIFFVEVKKTERKGGLFARGRSIHLSIARGHSMRMIIYKRPVNPDDYLHKAGPSGLSFVRGQSIQMITP